MVWKWRKQGNKEVCSSCERAKAYIQVYSNTLGHAETWNKISWRTSVHPENSTHRGRQAHIQSLALKTLGNNIVFFLGGGERKLNWKKLFGRSLIRTSESE